MKDDSRSHHGGAEAIRTSSFRVYYGGSRGSIPFKWESAPGTPIHALDSSTVTSSSAVLPLAPPPSFHFADDSKASAWSKSKFRPSLVVSILQKLTISVRHVSPLHSSTSLTSSYSSPSLQAGVKKTGSFRFGRSRGSGSGYSRTDSSLQAHSCGTYPNDTDHELSRTASFGSGYSDSKLRFEQRKRRFRGCFGN